MSKELSAPSSSICASAWLHGRASSVSLWACGVSLLSGLMYVNALHNPFVYDDYRLIVENASILAPGDLRGIVYRDITRPLVSLSYAADAAIWGSRPFGFHLTSVLLHMLNSALVLFLTWSISEDRRRQRHQRLPSASSLVVATTSALLLGVHPLMTQAVGYISGRSEVLCVALFLLAFMAARRWMLLGGAGWWLAAFGLWLLSLLAKETGVMLGFVLLCYDRLVLDGDAAARRRRLVLLHLPLLATTLLAAIARIAVLTEVEYPDQPATDWRFGLVAIDAMWRYLRLIVAPRGQSIFHEVPEITDQISAGALVPLLGVAALLAIAWRLRRLHSQVALGLFWFVLLLIPSGVLFALGRGEPMAEHRVYGASIGIFMAAGSGFGLLWRRFQHRSLVWRGLLYVLSALFVIQLCGRTILRNEVWGDPVVLSREAVSLAPDHWLPRILLGEALRTAGRCEEAIAEYTRAISIRPQEDFGYAKLAACLVETGRLEEASAALEKLDQIRPLSAQSSTGMALIDLLRNRPAEAREHLMRARQRNPLDQQASQLLAFVEGRLSADQARAICTDLQRLAPSGFASDRCRASTPASSSSGTVEGSDGPTQ